MPRKTLIFSFLVLIMGLICFSGFLIFNKVVFHYAEKNKDILLANTNDNKTVGIVALTGGRNRIETAVKLLNQGMGERLLISGVKPGTKVQTITKRENVELSIDKPVDLGYIATDTVGNAKEVGTWANMHGIEKMLVVTSFYHIPRSRLELEKETLNKELLFVAANTPFISKKWKNWRSTYFMTKEYIKFLIVYTQYKMLGL